MDTKGHHEISRVGSEIIREELRRAGRPDLRIEAFPLGNWLTDVSQVVDIPNYNKARHLLEGVNADIHALFRRLLDDSPSWIFESARLATGVDVKARVKKGLEDAEKAVVGGLEALLENGGELAAGLKRAFFYIGYFRFVLPKDGSSRERMDYGAYQRVVDDRFRAYYPHEHLDRPEVNGRIAKEKAGSPLNLLRFCAARTLAP